MTPQPAAAVGWQMLSATGYPSRHRPHSNNSRNKKLFSDRGIGPTSAAGGREGGVSNGGVALPPPPPPPPQAWEFVYLGNGAPPRPRPK